MSYIDSIKERAKQNKKTIWLPETEDKRTLLAAAKVLEEGIADVILVGSEEKVNDSANWLNIDLSGATVVDPATSPKLDAYVELLYETRKAKRKGPRNNGNLCTAGTTSWYFQNQD